MFIYENRLLIEPRVFNKVQSWFLSMTVGSLNIDVIMHGKKWIMGGHKTLNGMQWWGQNWGPTSMAKPFFFGSLTSTYSILEIFIINFPAITILCVLKPHYKNNWLLIGSNYKLMHFKIIKHMLKHKHISNPFFPLSKQKKGMKKERKCHKYDLCNFKRKTFDNLHCLKEGRIKCN